MYATYSDFATRYGTRLGEAEVTSHYLPFAAARLEAALAPCFSVPFSANNVTARDLTIDLAYLMVLERGRDAGDGEALRTRLQARLTGLAAGTEAMMTASGEALHARTARGEVWGSRARYRPVFDLREPWLQTVEPGATDEEG